MLARSSPGEQHVTPYKGKSQAKETIEQNELTGEGGIKAWRKESRIPSPPTTAHEFLSWAEQKTPDAATREKTLREIKDQLECRLNAERKAQIAAVKELDGLAVGEEVGQDGSLSCCPCRNQVMALLLWNRVFFVQYPMSLSLCQHVLSFPLYTCLYVCEHWLT